MKSYTRVEINMSLINCPECNKEISDKAKQCVYCGYPINSSEIYSLYITGYRDTDTAMLAGLREVLDLDLDYENIIEILNNLPYKIYECATKEESEILAKKLNKWWINVDVLDSNNKPVNINTNITICPKCSSTNIQIVPRKWSIITGIFTNKTDRICVNCKHKF